MRTRPNQGANCECCARRVAARSAARAVVPAPTPIIPSPEPSTPPAPEPIHSGEGSTITIEVGPLNVTPEALAAGIVKAVEAERASSERQAEIAAIRAEFAPTVEVIENEPPREVVGDIPADAPPPVVAVSVPVPPPPTRRSKRRR